MPQLLTTFNMVQTYDIMDAGHNKGDNKYTQDTTKAITNTHRTQQRQ